MSHFRRVTVLGMQPVPKFANKATLCMAGQCFNNAFPWPEAEGIYNIACLGFFPRSVILDDLVVTRHQPMAISYWAKDHTVGIDNVYSQDEVAVPQGSEYFAVSWLTPTIAMLAGGSKPLPEDFFKLRFALKL